jgi:uncharacterized protein YecT (DUF1311 family)
MTPAQNTAAYIQGFEDGKRVAQVEIKRELAQRTWVGLKDKELEEFSEAKLGSYDLCLEVEAKLQQKNT